ncbi:hypothetical protein [Glycomyces albidus]|uniref:DUF3558 domain-containing protein n=1 Tax=Glycomyces albidus TaxID=2656774 RepID=A0A6L5GCL2_9ACTN|nr:hypothetical protein [Glycomyces albidus]MQM27405.1 hypothetical protein [Glycomyces albidus]
MTRNLTLIKGLAAAGAAGLLLTGCGGNDPTMPPDGGATGDSDGGGSGSSSYSVMAEWEGCEALDDIQPIQEFMGIQDWGTNGLKSSDIPSGLDGEAFNCGADMATVAVYTSESEVTGNRDYPGTSTIDIGVAPWESDAEATENFQSRVDQLTEALETGGTEYSNVQEGEIEGDWDESFYFAGNSATGYSLSAIVRKADIVFYAFIDYTTDPAVEHDSEPIYPFTDEEFRTWVIGEYMPTTYADLLAKKESGL